MIWLATSRISGTVWAEPKSQDLNAGARLEHRSRSWFTQFGGTQTLTVADRALSGNDALLMNDYLVSFTAIENCLFFNNLEPGAYEVIIYARMPAQPTGLSLTNVDQEPATRTGTWGDCNVGIADFLMLLANWS